MALFNWSDRFSVKIESIDNQHKKLVEYVNQLHEGMVTGKGAEVLKPILDNLIKYTAEHFAYEEKLFVQHNYTGGNAHKTSHQKLVDQVVQFKTNFEAGKATVSTELMNFLRDWLMTHIVKEDMAYSPYLVQKGVK